MTNDHDHTWQPLHVPQSAIHALNEWHKHHYSNGESPGPIQIEAWFVCDGCALAELHAIDVE